MLKSASLGDDFQELLNQNSLSQMVNQNMQNGEGSRFSQKQSQVGLQSSQVKSATHTRHNSNQLLENESSKELAQHLQPNSFLPASNSHSLLNSQRNFEYLDEGNIEFEKGVGAREGARTRSRLFMENKDLIQPKSGISQEEIPAGEGETLTFKQKLGPARQVNVNTYSMQPQLSQHPHAHQYSNQQQLSQQTQQQPSQNEKKDPPSLLAVYDMKPRVSQISSQSMQSAIAFKQYLIKEANNMQLLNTQQPPSTHTIGGSHLLNTHHVGSGLINTVTQRRSVGLFTSDNPISIQSKMPQIPAVNTFLNVHKFASELKKRLRFSRPEELSEMQLDILNDKGSKTYAEIQQDLPLSKKSIANATREWIHAPRNLRALKRSCKPIYIAFIKAKFSCRKLLRDDSFLGLLIPRIPVESTFNLIREALMILLTIVNYVVVPLNCAFDNYSNLNVSDQDRSISDNATKNSLTNEITTVSAYVCFVNIVLLFFTQYFEFGQKVTSPKSIAVKYASTYFVFDVLTGASLLFDSHPFIQLIFFARMLYGSTLGSSQQSSSCSITMYVRKLLVKYMSISALLNVIITVIITFFHCHIIACAWLYTIRSVDSSWATSISLWNLQKPDQYLKSIFFAVQLLTNASNSSSSSIAMWSTSELIFLVVVSVYTCCLLAYIFSSIHSALKEFSAQNTSYLQGLSNIEKFIESREISENLRLEMRKQFEYMHFSSSKVIQPVASSSSMRQSHHSASSPLLPPLQANLTKKLQERVIHEVFSTMYYQNIILREYFDNDGLMVQLSRKAREHQYSPGQLIMRQNSLTMPCLHFIVEGSVEVIIEKSSTNGVNCETSVVLELQKYQSFGELEFFTQSFHTSLSVRAKTHASIMSIALSEFHDAIQSLPNEKEAFCYLKDCIVLNKDYGPIGLSCLSCKSNRHSIAECPMLSFQKSMERTLLNIDQQISKQIAEFKRSMKRKPFPTVSYAQRTHQQIMGFTSNNEDLMNTSLYEEYLDEVDSEKQSFFKQQTAPILDEKSTYTRKTSKKLSLKQAQTVDDLSFQRKNSKNQTQKLLTPNNLNNIEEIHEKSQISRISQFSNRPPKIMMDYDDRKSQHQPGQVAVVAGGGGGVSVGQGGGAGASAGPGTMTMMMTTTNQIPSDYEIPPTQSRKRTHSGISQIIGSRKSPFPSERGDWNRSYSGSLISSLRLSEADKKALNIDDKNGLESSRLVPTTTPNLFVIRINEGGEDSSNGHPKGQYYSNAGSSIFAPEQREALESQVRRNSTGYSVYSRNVLQSSQFPIHEEFSELRLDQQTNRGRDSSLYQLEFEHQQFPMLSLDNPNQMVQHGYGYGQYASAAAAAVAAAGMGNKFEEQQNFKMYFAHNNLQNVISQPNANAAATNVKNANNNNNHGNDSKNARSTNIYKAKRPAKNRFLRVVSVNNSSSSSKTAPKKIHKISISHPEQIPALLPYKKVSDAK